MPRAAPVIRAVFPSRSFISCGLVCRWFVFTSAKLRKFCVANKFEVHLARLAYKFYNNCLDERKIIVNFVAADRNAEAPVRGHVRRDVINIKESVYPR